MFPHIKLLNSEPTELEDITSFNGRTGPVVPQEGDYKLYYAPASNTVILVQQAADFGSVIDSSKVYLIDGVVDMTGSGVSLEVPSGGVNIHGYTFDASKLICSDNNYTLFTSPVSGSGNVLMHDIGIEITGTSSQVFDIKSFTGFEAVEFAAMNFNDCSSLGTFDNYRQGFESGTGRFGGSPNLILKGAWVGGYYMEGFIVRSLDAGFTGSLFEAGVGFTMSSRFRTDWNVDLPASASLFDFTASNFQNTSTLQLTGCIVTRNGVTNSTDANYTPNISSSDIASLWKGNVGIPNTFIGARQLLTTEITTTINTIDVYETMLGTWTADHLEHFDSPLNGQLRHLGDNPVEFKVLVDAILECNANRVVSIRVVVWDDSASTLVYYDIIQRQVNSLSGGRDVAFITHFTDIILDTNDYVYLEVANHTDTNNITVELGAVLEIEER